MSQTVIKKAFHRLILPCGEILPMAVVVFDVEGNVLSWHAMSQEEPFTEWIGGTYDLRN